MAELLNFERDVPGELFQFREPVILEGLKCVQRHTRDYEIEIFCGLVAASCREQSRSFFVETVRDGRSLVPHEGFHYTVFAIRFEVVPDDAGIRFMTRRNFPLLHSGRP